MAAADHKIHSKTASEINKIKLFTNYLLKHLAGEEIKKNYSVKILKFCKKIDLPPQTQLFSP